MVDFALAEPERTANVDYLLEPRGSSNWAGVKRDIDLYAHLAPRAQRASVKVAFRWHDTGKKFTIERPVHRLTTPTAG